MPPRAPADLDLDLAERALELVVHDDEFGARALVGGEVAEEGPPGGGEGGAGVVHEGGGLPEGEGGGC